MMILKLLSFLMLYVNLPISLGTTGSDAVDTLEETHGKIIHASVLFRHGDRFGINTYPNDPYASLVWPDEKNAPLMKRGKQRLYDVGKWFRVRYNETGLYKGYKYDMVLTNSSSTDRTLMSAEAFLAGLLPPNADEMWADDGLRWQPIPVHSKPFEEDEVIGMRAPCERYTLEENRIAQSQMLKKYYQNNKEFLDFVALKTGYNISNDDILTPLLNMAKAYDALTVNVEFNLTLPSWTDGIFPKPMDTLLYATGLALWAGSPEMQRLQAGPMLGYMVSDMTRKRDGSFNQTFHFYSGHDNTIVSLLVTLGLFNYLPPPYGSSVIIELRLKDTEYIVTILYRNETDHSPYMLTIPKCGYICTLDEFIKITKPMIPENWQEECRVGLIEKLLYYNSTLLTVLFCVVIIALAMLVVYLSFWFWKYYCSSTSSAYNKFL